MSDEDPGFRVIDRRGGGGAEAPPPPAAPQGAEPAKPEPPHVAAPPEAAAPRADAAPKSATPLPKLDFSTFVFSLSTSGFYHLGLVPDPATGQPGEKNVELARQTIETLEILEEKTRGNLDAEETRLLQSLLYELRMRFVEASR